MKRTFTQQNLYDAWSLASFGSSSPTRSKGDLEQPGAAPVSGDLAEGLVPGWESAWIDLGGEG